MNLRSDISRHLTHFMRQSLHDLGGLALATFIRNWMRSLRYQCAYYQPEIDPVHPQFSGPAIYVFWHEYIPFMFYLRGHCNLAMLVSQHRDAELLSRSAGVMGFELVRGSSRRGAISALRTLIRRGRGMNLTLTPDGPKGPRRELAPGCLYLSAKLGIPLVPLGLGYDRPWRNRRAWDQFAIPRPWSRAQAIIGPAIQIPVDADRSSMESWRIKIQDILNQLTDLAEQAASGRTTIAQSSPVYRTAIPLALYRTPLPTLQIAELPPLESDHASARVHRRAA